LQVQLCLAPAQHLVDVRLRLQLVLLLLLLLLLLTFKVGEGQLACLRLVLVLLLSVVECATASCLACWRQGLWRNDMEQQVQPAGAAEDLEHI
jgi:hypothetical protein